MDFDEVKNAHLSAETSWRPPPGRPVAGETWGPVRARPRMQPGPRRVCRDTGEPRPHGSRPETTVSQVI